MSVFYPPISPELRDAILSAFAGFTPSDREQDDRIAALLRPTAGGAS